MELCWRVYGLSPGSVGGPAVTVAARLTVPGNAVTSLCGHAGVHARSERRGAPIQPTGVSSGAAASHLGAWSIHAGG